MRLFDNWYELVDEKTGRNYYYNSDSKESTWIKPTKEDTKSVIEYIEQIEKLQLELNHEKIKSLEQDSKQKQNELKLQLQVEKLKNQIKQMENNQFKNKTEEEYIQEIEELNLKLNDSEKTSFHKKPEDKYIKEIELLKQNLEEQQIINEKLKTENSFVEKERKPNQIPKRKSINSKPPPALPKRPPSIILPAVPEFGIKKVQEQKMSPKKEEIKNEEEIEEEEEELGPLPVIHQYYDHLGHIRLYVMENRQIKYLYDQSLTDHDEKFIVGNWLELYDERNHKKFFYNTKTHKSSWDDPRLLNVEEKQNPRFSFPSKDVMVEKLFKNQRLSHPPNYHEQKEEKIDNKEFSKRKSFLASFFEKK